MQIMIRGVVCLFGAKPPQMSEIKPPNQRIQSENCPIWEQNVHEGLIEVK
jgi:hypothetical protein